MQSKTVHHHGSPAAYDGEEDETEDDEDDDDGNPNIGAPQNLPYAPTYHYTDPRPRTDGGGDDETAAASPPMPVMDPKLAWLASFPNSGTSFTLGMVARATNTTFATNYGIEANYGDRSVPSMPVYRHRGSSAEGPYMPDPLTSFHHRKLPYGKHVLTKTHCGGYCVNCDPKTYAYGYTPAEAEAAEAPPLGGAETAAAGDASGDTAAPLPPVSSSFQHDHGEAFLSDCASGLAVDDKGNLVSVRYPPERVSRVVHLIRNPFHNAIARFHLERDHHADANTTSDREWLESHPDDRAGFQRFCAEQDAKRFNAEDEFFGSPFFFPGDSGGLQQRPQREQRVQQRTFSRRNGGSARSATTPGMPAETGIADAGSWKELTARVPCRADFFRYVQWHNLLHESLDALPGPPRKVLTLYYEGFHDHDDDHDDDRSESGGGDSPPSRVNRGTAGALLDFLGLTPVEDENGNIKWSEFRSRDRDYDSFFDPAQREDVRAFLHALASFRVWSEIQHYLPPAPPPPTPPTPPTDVP